MTMSNIIFVELKCHADALADAAHLVYWLPNNRHHKEALGNQITAMKEMLARLEEGK